MKDEELGEFLLDIYTDGYQCCGGSADYIDQKVIELREILGD